MPATQQAHLRIALRASAEPRLGANLATLILALLVRLFSRTEATWDHSPHFKDTAGSASKTFLAPAIGRAPHAACVEAGLVPDWILPGIRNRGMRPVSRPARQRPRAQPARAPPGAAPIPS